jgi:hypothetical protein
LALAATIIGVGIAALTLDRLVALSPADIPRLGEASLDGRVRVLAIAFAVATTLLVGIAPAAHLGARRGHVVALMIVQAARPAAVGLAIGVLGSLLATRVLSGLLFEIAPRSIPRTR